MYLKEVEMIGFKSFAQKTKLTFEPGMTAIVGPNGCGKSNIADAIRWVLGEQSPKALRGGSMQDVIFTGTDTQKALGMAEVSLTLTDCEETLGTEYNEVTVTRRVLRSGEGTYFINRTPCRLKDIQRLFMDSGIGTTSYSTMEQGRIDRILSSRPEDRRSVFEEASGITKYKADKKEALRKLEHTEANLLRLEDIIREVRRQIISLQRQAGKARRYQTMQDQLRGFDLYFTRERLHELETAIKELEAQHAGLKEKEEAVREEAQELDNAVSSARETIAHFEADINATMESASEAKSRAQRCRESIGVNQDRIEELQELASRDERDAGGAMQRLDHYRKEASGLTRLQEDAAGRRDKAKQALDGHSAHLDEFEEKTRETNQLLHGLRSELVDLESRTASLQNELSDLEAQDRTLIVRRERLAAEQSELSRHAEDYNERQDDLATKRERLLNEVQRREDECEKLEKARQQCDEDRTDSSQERGSLQTKIAARNAEVGILQQRHREREGLPEGARRILSGADDSLGMSIQALGVLADHLHIPERYRLAVESALRHSVDAIIVNDGEAARTLADYLAQTHAGSVDILPAVPDATIKSDGKHWNGDLLLNHIEFPEKVRELLHHLLDHVYVLPPGEALPAEIPAGMAIVREDGLLADGYGSASLRLPEETESTTLGQQAQLVACQDALAHLQAQEEVLAKRKKGQDDLYRTLASNLGTARQHLEKARYDLAVCEGEEQVVDAEAKLALARLETVRFERESLVTQNTSSEARRTEILHTLDHARGQQDATRTAIAEKTEALRRLDKEHGSLASTMTEHRIHFAECRQQEDGLARQEEGLRERIEELESIHHARRETIGTYRKRIAALQQVISESEEQLPPTEEACANAFTRLAELRGIRENDLLEAGKRETLLREKRKYLDEIIRNRSGVEVEFAEARIRHQTQIDRIATEYQIPVEEVLAVEEPEWEGESPPDQDTQETLIGELRTKLDAMGPVNLVAIEEHRELEERYAFLTQQQDDLVKAKQQLLDMIRHINKTTTELFATTFNQVNSNFQEMFKRMFGGGSAKLVLIDEEDVLESGIEIIARPPGKRLQSVSLLSGGERTMTAVGLLFALYQVKPSAFCVLDELDAALDETNIGRFVDVVQGFLSDSQFIIITHNRRTISASDVLYGVTMHEQGVSSIVSVKLSAYGLDKDIPKGDRPMLKV